MSYEYIFYRWRDGERQAFAHWHAHGGDGWLWELVNRGEATLEGDGYPLICKVQLASVLPYLSNGPQVIGSLQEFLTGIEHAEQIEIFGWDEDTDLIRAMREDQVAVSQQLVESEERYRLLAENSVDVVAHVGADGIVKWVSPSVESTFGVPRSRWIGRPAEDVVAPADQQLAEDAASAVRRGGTALLRMRTLDADGGVQWSEVHSKPYYDRSGMQDGMISSFRLVDDRVVDEQRRDAAAAEQSEADARLRKLMKASNIGMVLGAADGKFAVVNQALCDQLGYDEESLISKTWQEITPAIYLEAEFRSIADLLAGRFDNYRMLKEHIRADGSLMWVDISVTCLRDAEGQVGHFLAQVVDVSELVESRQRILEQERQNRELAQQLADELASAAVYVKSILPGELSGPVRVCSRYLPSQRVGGDSFDYRWVDEDHLMVYLIDVSGHGVDAALLSVSVHNMLRSGTISTATLLEPRKVMAQLNNLFQMGHQGNRFFTIWFGIYEKSTRQLRYASAGHPPALALSIDNDVATATPLATKSIPIGVTANFEFITDTHYMPSGSQLLLYSDGAYELIDTGGQWWSLDGFIDLCTEMAKQRNLSLDALVGRLEQLAADRTFLDDCALIQLNFD